MAALVYGVTIMVIKRNVIRLLLRFLYPWLIQEVGFWGLVFENAQDRFDRSLVFMSNSDWNLSHHALLVRISPMSPQFFCHCYKRLSRSSSVYVLYGKLGHSSFLTFIIRKKLWWWKYKQHVWGILPRKLELILPDVTFEFLLVQKLCSSWTGNFVPLLFFPSEDHPLNKPKLEPFTQSAERCNFVDMANHEHDSKQ